VVGEENQDFLFLIQRIQL